MVVKKYGRTSLLNAISVELGSNNEGDKSLEGASGRLPDMNLHPGGKEGVLREAFMHDEGYHIFFKLLQP